MRRRGDENAFDRTEVIAATMRIVVGPTVIDSASDADKQLLSDVNGLEGIELLVLSANNAVLREFAEAGFTTCFIEESPSSYVLYAPKRFTDLTSRECARVWYRQLPAPEDAWLEYLVVNHDRGADLVVGSQAAVDALTRREGLAAYCGLEDFARRVRLFLVASHRTQVEPRHFLNEGLYFLY